MINTSEQWKQNHQFQRNKFRSDQLLLRRDCLLLRSREALRRRSFSFVRFFSTEASLRGDGEDEEEEDDAFPSFLRCSLFNRRFFRSTEESLALEEELFERFFFEEFFRRSLGLLFR